MAVMLAIGRNDVEIVRLLVEVHEHINPSILSNYSPVPHASLVNPPQDGETLDHHATAVMSMPQSSSSISKGKKRKRTKEYIQESSSSSLLVSSASSAFSSSSPKKRKLQDRIQVTSEMLELAVKQRCEPLIQFFMSKGGCIRPFRSLFALPGPLELMNLF